MGLDNHATDVTLPAICSQHQPCPLSPPSPSSPHCLPQPWCGEPRAKQGWGGWPAMAGGGKETIWW